MKIAIDIDNTLSPTFKTIINYLNKKYKLKKNPKKSFTPTGYDLFHSNFKTFFPDWKEFVKSKDHHYMKPIPHSVKVIEKLSKKNQIYIITARDHSQKIPTIIWIDKNYKNKFEEILFIDYHKDHQTKKYTKGDLCKKLKIDIMIEDCLDEIKDISRKNKKIKIYLFDKNNQYNWNKKRPLPKNTEVIKSWNEIKEKLKNNL